MSDEEFLRRMVARLGQAGDLEAIMLPALDFARLVEMARRAIAKEGAQETR